MFSTNSYVENGGLVEILMQTAELANSGKRPSTKSPSVRFWWWSPMCALLAFELGHIDSIS